MTTRERQLLALLAIVSVMLKFSIKINKGKHANAYMRVCLFSKADKAREALFKFSKRYTLLQLHDDLRNVDFDKLLGTEE